MKRTFEYLHALFTYAPDEGGGGDGGDDGSGGGSGGDDKGGGGETVTLSKAEVDKLNEAVATANRRLRDAEKSAEKAAEEAKRKGGDYEKLFEEEKAKREALEQSVANAAHERNVATVAGRLRFRDPSDAHRFLDLEPGSSESAIESALKAVAKSKAYLVDDAPRRQGGGVGHNGGAPTTVEAGNATMNAEIRRQAGRG